MAKVELRQPLLTGSVRLGIAEDVAGSRLPEVLGRFRRLHPGVRLQVETGLSGLLADRLLRGDFDIVLSKRADPRQGGQVIWSEPLVWVVAPEFADLAGQHPLPLVLYPRPSVTAEAVYAVLRHAGIDSFVALTSPSIAGLRAGVLAGLGITAFGRHFIPAGLRELQAHEARLPPLHALEFGLEQRDGHLPEAVRALSELIGREMRDDVTARAG